MLACSSTSARASRRLAAALFVSALAHAFLSLTVKPGFSGRNASDIPRPHTASMAARLVVWQPGEKVSSAPQPQPQQPPHASSHAALKREAPRLGRAAPADALQTKNPGPAEIPDPTYYAARELDVYPSLENGMDPQYAASDSAGVKGHVLLLVLIDAQGGVDEVNVVEAVPPGHFEDDARRAFQSVRFKPALKNGRAVKSRVLVRIEYGPAESGAR